MSTDFYKKEINQCENIFKIHNENQDSISRLIKENNLISSIGVGSDENNALFLSICLTTRCVKLKDGREIPIKFSTLPGPLRWASDIGKCDQSSDDDDDDEDEEDVSNEQDSYIHKSVKYWEISDVVDWIKSLKFSTDFSEIIEMEMIDGMTLLNMNENDWEKLKFPMDARKTILMELEKINK